jgi:UDP-N-acetyl-D-mannosaminuronate dehydrogenase
LPGSAWPGARSLRSVGITADTLRSYDCVVIATDHRDFDYQLIATSAQLIVDSRNSVRARASHVFRVGAPHPQVADAPVLV